MSLPIPALALLALSLLLSAIYGLALLNNPPSLVRALVKAGSVAALAGAAAVVSADGPMPLLIAALAMSALGDFLLAFSKTWMLALGILAFLVAQLIYAGVFFIFWFSAGDLTPLWPRYVLIGLIVIAALGFIVWLWRSLGAMKFGVIPYTSAIVLMASLAMMNEWRAWPAIAGALLFVGSDGVLSAELFKLKPDAPARRVTGPIVWWTYYLAQIGLAAGITLTALAV